MKGSNRPKDNLVSSKIFKKLVEELLKSQPDQHIVKQLMKDQGLSYSMDPIVQMSTVLDSMGNIKLSKESEPEVLS